MSHPLVSDALWKRVQSLIPVRPSQRVGRGRPAVQDRAVFTGIVFVLCTGIPWRYLPAAELRCGSAVTCWRRLRDWQQAGLWQHLWAHLLEDLGRRGLVHWQRAALDSSSVPAKRGAHLPDPTLPTAAVRAPNTIC